jgi:hypothetical protein
MRAVRLLTAPAAQPRAQLPGADREEHGRPAPHRRERERSLLDWHPGHVRKGQDHACILAPRGRRRKLYFAEGLMFWFRWNRLCGSYLSFSATRRAYLSSP